MAQAQKTVTNPVQVSDSDHERITLQPGDKVPAWAEKHIKPQYLTEGHTVAAGMDLFNDQTYQSMLEAALRVGYEREELAGLDSSQIAALIRQRLFGQEVMEATGDEDLLEELEESMSDSESAMKTLFGETNSAGNVNAPDLGASVTEITPQAKTEPKMGQGKGGAQS